MGMLERDTEIYLDRDALREDYQPENLVGRDTELNRYRAALQPVINGEQLNNIFLHGKTGVGQTAGFGLLLLDRIQRELGYRPSRTLAQALPEMVQQFSGAIH
jgi:Cdc6-like AAA superfamily ATPase